MRAAAIRHDEEQRLVRAFFGNSAEGFFVEIGVADPFERSQTWHLEQMGWTGVLVEPQPDRAVKLVKTRKAMVFAAACSAPQDAGADPPRHGAGRNANAPGRTLDAMLMEAGAPSPIGFLSIDAGGLAVEVLHGIDFAHWKPRLIIIQDRVGNLAKHWYLQSSGYRLIRRAGGNGWYVPADTQVEIRWSDRWAIWRKYYLALPLRLGRNALGGLRRAIKRFS